MKVIFNFCFAYLQCFETIMTCNIKQSYLFLLFYAIYYYKKYSTINNNNC